MAQCIRSVSDTLAVFWPPYPQCRRAVHVVARTSRSLRYAVRL